jgi:putative membrane protein
MPRGAHRTENRLEFNGIHHNDVDVLEVLPVQMSMYFHDHIWMNANRVAAETARDVVTLWFVGGVIAASPVVIHANPPVGAQGEPASAFEQSYLYQATEAQQAQVALGQMAVQKASSDQVKQYGARMVQDHQRVSEELTKLTSQEGMRETGELSMPHQRIQRMLSQLSGKEFDKAYMAFIVRDHMRAVENWEKRGPMLADPRIVHWMAGLLPILKDHLERGRAIAASIGVNANDLAKADDATSPSTPLLSQ